MVQPRIKGFTLIELIIGITILALLAVGLLAALDPAEQFNKARDTSTRNTLLEIYSAFQRYEAAQEQYPPLLQALADGAGFDAAKTGITDIRALVASGELKQNFESAAGTALSKIFIYKDATSGKLMVCYKPTAKSFRLAAGLFTNAGAMADLKSGPDTAPSNPDSMVDCQWDDNETNCSLAGSVPTDRECCVYCAQ